MAKDIDKCYHLIIRNPHSYEKFIKLNKNTENILTKINVYGFLENDLKVKKL